MGYLKDLSLSSLQWRLVGIVGTIGIMNPTSPTEPTADFVRPAEVAKRYGVHERTVRNWMRRGIIPGVRQGRIIRLRMSDAIAALESPTPAKA